jgi:GNAT superfamily N-acetyltransferase
MKDLLIRKATVNDIGKINLIHQGEEGPWADLDMCAAWVTRRLERDFFILVAEFDGKPAGHGEWIVSDELIGKTFFLGQLQIAKAYQRLGIGKAMLKAGEEEALKRGCASVTTIPEPDTTSNIFYEKCGYTVSRRFITAETEVCGNAKPETMTVIDEIPESVIGAMRFLIGLSQSASRHIWEVISRRPEGNNRTVKCAAFPDGSYAAISWFGSNQTAYADAFGNVPADAALGHCFSLADAFGVKQICFEADQQHKELLDHYVIQDIQETHVEMIKKL